MIAAADIELEQLPPGSHVGWVVNRDEGYVERAARLFAAGKLAGEKVVAFGPQDSEVLHALRADAEIATDPLVAFLNNGPLVPDTMFSMFREQNSIARGEGFRGLRVVADMDWMLPAGPCADEVLSFELLLDRVVAQLGATVFCAYRTSSFGPDILDGQLAVHPSISGAVDPQFRITASADGWRLSGEVDLAVVSSFATAVRAALSDGACTFDVGALAFIDVLGMTQLARACADAATPVRVRGASSVLRRAWHLGGLDRIAPLNEI